MRRVFEFNDNKIEVNNYGEKGKTILLLAGWTHDFQYETNFIKALAINHKVITFSYPGYAGSDETKNAQTIEYLSSIIENIVHKLELNEFTLVGFSMGCQVVLSYLESHPKQKAILISPIMHSLLHDTPGYGKFLLSSSILINLIRSITPIKKFLVDKAYSNISGVTEGSYDSAKFDDPHVTLNGAYDTLIATINSFIDPIEYKDRVKFIFGDKEIEKRRLDNHKVKYLAINDSGHGVFDSRYKEIVKLIG